MCSGRPYLRGSLMYTLEVRIYQPPGQIRAYGELYGDREHDEEPVATAHVSSKAAGPALPFDHPRIQAHITWLCTELSQNLGDLELWRGAVEF